jgi:hypothetical protein
MSDTIDPYWRKLNLVVVERGVFGWKPVKELGFPTPMLIDLSNDGKYHEAWPAPLGTEIQWRARDDAYDAKHKPADVPYRMVMVARPPDEP